jgi:2-oxoglutarate dehydrogenase E1 component
VDVLTHPRRADAAAVAVCRMEQWFPMPVREMTEILAGYPNVSEVVWLQEEPENMGAWDFARPALESMAGARRLTVLARPRSSSPAEGSAVVHAKNQERLIAQALGIGT